jgi:hypothetical protein
VRVASSRSSTFGRQATELGGADTRTSENTVVDRRYLTWHLLGSSWGPRHVACGEWSRLSWRANQNGPRCPRSPAPTSIRTTPLPSANSPVPGVCLCLNFRAPSPHAFRWRTHIDLALQKRYFCADQETSLDVHRTTVMVVADVVDSKDHSRSNY